MPQSVTPDNVELLEHLERMRGSAARLVRASFPETLRHYPVVEQYETSTGPCVKVQPNFDAREGVKFLRDIGFDVTHYVTGHYPVDLHAWGTSDRSGFSSICWLNIVEGMPAIEVASLMKGISALSVFPRVSTVPRQRTPIPASPDWMPDLTEAQRAFIRAEYPLSGEPANDSDQSPGMSG